ncbi:MAG: fibronectin type III domain-containing protein, partial [Pseudomonadales bacterium]|nr:fibronectin type III domain-containing protein [Pseudomonadales bacterium]
MLTRFQSLCFAFALLFCVPAIAQNNTILGTPPWQTASGWPDRVIQNFSDDPARTITVTWRTDSSVQNTLAQIALATPDARFDAAAQSIAAITESVYLSTAMVDGVPLLSPDNVGLGVVHYHSAVFRDLEPDTLYA